MGCVFLPTNIDTYSSGQQKTIGGVTCVFGDGRSITSVRGCEVERVSRRSNSMVPTSPVIPYSNIMLKRSTAQQAVLDPLIKWNAS